MIGAKGKEGLSPHCTKGIVYSRFDGDKDKIPSKNPYLFKYEKS